MKNCKSLCASVIVLSGLLISAAKSDKEAPVGYKNTPFLPDGKWRVHDINRPQPPVVKPGESTGKAPSDGVVLFNGTDLSQWLGRDKAKGKGKNKKPGKIREARWKVKDGYMEANGTGSIWTKEAFGSCQLHVEWAAPEKVVGSSQKRGNSGIFLMKLYEVQILDSYNNRTYADGSAGSIYAQRPPLVNASRAPGKWQTYDIIFEAPLFKGNKLVTPAFITLIYNGIVVQHRTELLGRATHKKLSSYKPHPEKMPLQLQDHKNPIRFRNIWIRPFKPYDGQ